MGRGSNGDGATVWRQRESGCSSGGNQAPKLEQRSSGAAATLRGTLEPNAREFR